MKEEFWTAIRVTLLVMIIGLLLSFTPADGQPNRTCVKQYCHSWAVRSFATGLFEERLCCHCREYGPGEDMKTFERPLWMSSNQKKN